MNGGFTTIGDLFPDLKIRCSVPGCNNLRPPGDHPVPEGTEKFMENACVTCKKLYPKLQDQSVPCARKECSETWVWSRREQLEAAAAGHGKPPARLCHQCQKQLAQLQDTELPCRVKGCQLTWTWTAREQMQHGDEPPPQRFCQQCHHDYQHLRDLELRCRIKGCTGIWRWNVYKQLEHLVAGHDLDKNQPQRLCEECYTKLQELTDKEMPCKIKGCKRTWQYSAYQQLEKLIQNGPDTPELSRMCRECFDFLQQTEDEPRRCRFRGCQNTWLYTKSMKLHDWLHGRKQPPPRACPKCSDLLQTTADKEMPCMVTGCNATWTYTAEEQVRNRGLGKPAPLPRRCAECEQFLAATEPMEIHCAACQAAIAWSAYEQLMFKLGSFAKPELCFDCAKEQLNAGKTIDVPKEHHQVVRIPANGRWNADSRIVEWPPHINKETIAKAENADYRIVVLGDDLSFNSEAPDQTWPLLLEQQLNEACHGKMSVAVINAAIPGTTSAQAAVRLPRDVKPFGPHLVIFSFAFADSWIRPESAQKEPSYLLQPEDADAAFDQLLRKLKDLKTELLYWTTNPMLPELQQKAHPQQQLTRWISLQQANKLQRLAHAKHICGINKIPILDLRSRFEVNGTASAAKWMQDWCMPNQTGIRNIASWFTEHIMRGKYLTGNTDN